MKSENKPAVKKMLAPGHYINEQLPDEWSDKDLEKLVRPGKSAETSSKSEASQSPHQSE